MKNAKTQEDLMLLEQIRRTGRINPTKHLERDGHTPTNAEIEESINRWEDEMAAMAPDLFWQ